METQTRLAPGYWALDQHGNMWQLCDIHAEYFARDHGLEWHTYRLWGGPERGWAGDDQHGPAAWPFFLGDDFDTPPACVDCLTYLEGDLTPYGREYVRETFTPDMWKLWGVSYGL